MATRLKRYNENSTRQVNNISEAQLSLLNHLNEANPGQWWTGRAMQRAVCVGGKCWGFDVTCGEHTLFCFIWKVANNEYIAAPCDLVEADRTYSVPSSLGTEYTYDPDNDDMVPVSDQ